MKRKIKVVITENHIVVAQIITFYKNNMIIRRMPIMKKP